MADRTFYGFKSDFDDRNQPMYAKHVNSTLGIDVSYRLPDEKKYFREFKSAKEAGDYLEKHPPSYTQDDKEAFLHTLDRYKTLDYGSFTNSNFDKKTLIDIESSTSDKNANKSNLSYKIPFTMGLKDLPAEVLYNPFYFIPEVENVLLKKSKIIKEIILALKPMIIPPPDKRYRVTGEYMTIVFNEIGIFVVEKSMTEANDIWILHCKMDEVDDGSEDKLSNEVTEMDKRQAEYTESFRGKVIRNALDIPILRESTKDISIDYNDPDSIESYVQGDMSLRIILKEINRDNNKKDDGLQGRNFVFTCFFFV